MCRVLRQVALQFHHGLLQLGLDAVLIDPLTVAGEDTTLPSTIDPERQMIIFGSNMLASKVSLEAAHRLFPPERTVLYNLEQVTSMKQTDWHWINGPFLALLKSYRVWDHMPENVEALQKMGVQALAAVPIGYSPALSRVKQLPDAEQVPPSIDGRNFVPDACLLLQDIAAMFVGTVSDHRLQIIFGLQKVDHLNQVAPHTCPLRCDGPCVLTFAGGVSGGAPARQADRGSAEGCPPGGDSRREQFSVWGREG